MRCAGCIPAGLRWFLEAALKKTRTLSSSAHPSSLEDIVSLTSSYHTFADGPQFVLHRCIAFHETSWKLINWGNVATKPPVLLSVPLPFRLSSYSDNDQSRRGKPRYRTSFADSKRAGQQDVRVAQHQKALRAVDKLRRRWCRMRCRGVCVHAHRIGMAMMATWHSGGSLVPTRTELLGSGDA